MCFLTTKLLDYIISVFVRPRNHTLRKVKLGSMSFVTYCASLFEYFFVVTSVINLRGCYYGQIYLSIEKLAFLCKCN